MAEASTLRKMEEDKMSRFDGVVEVIREKIGEGYTVGHQETVKNNGLVLDGVIIVAKGEAVSPTVYITEQMLDDMGEEGLADYVIEVYENHKSDMEVDVKQITSKEYILENVEYKLVGAEANQQKLSCVPHKLLADMAAFYVVVVNNDENGMASYTLTNENVAGLGVGIEEIDEAARRNTLEKGGVEFISMEDTMNSMMFGMPVEKKAIEDATFDTPGFYVLSNKRRMGGATLLMYAELLAQISDRAGTDLYILPSSIHEVLVMKDDELIDVEHLKQMVGEVNCQEVQPDEVLTNSVYKYSKEEGLQKVA